MPSAYRQEVLNVLFAQLLQERGVISAPENIIYYGAEHKRRMPDVTIVNFQGLRTVIEAEVGGPPDAYTKALDSAKHRVEEGIAHIGVAIVYPAALRNMISLEAAPQLKQQLADAQLAIAIVTESGATGFVPGDVDYLTSALHNTFEQLIREDVVAKAVAELDAGINKFASIIAAKPGIVGRVAETMGIRELPKREKSVDEEEE
jgi:hypothetical protein